jgi:hypothetical protein
MNKHLKSQRKIKLTIYPKTKKTNFTQSVKLNDLIKSTKWSSGFTDHNMFKYFKPDFYKYFLKDSPKNTRKNHNNHNKTQKIKGTAF